MSECFHNVPTARVGDEGAMSIEFRALVKGWRGGGRGLGKGDL